MHPGLHGTTFGGGPLSCAVAVEFLKQMEKLLGHIRKTGDYFRAQLEWLAARHSRVREVRGLGLMLAVDLDSADAAKAVARLLLEQGIIINRTHETVLRFLPPYIVEKKHIDEVIAALDSALETKSGSKAPRVKVPAAPLRAVHKRKARRSHA